ADAVDNAEDVGRSATICLVQLIRGLGELATQQRRQDGAAAINDGFDALLLIAARTLQHKPHHLLIQSQGTGMSDADTQAPEIRTGKCGSNITQSIMAGMPSTPLQLDRA